MKNVSIWILSALMFLSADVYALSNKRVTGSKKLVTKEVKVDDFKHLIVQGSCDVVFTQTSGKQKVQVYGSDNLVNLVVLKVKDNVLTVTYKKGYSISLKNGAKLEVRIAAPMVKSATVSGSGDLDFKSNIETNKDVTLCVNGSGDIDAGKITCATLTTKINGSGDIEVESVKATSVNANVNGSGDIKLNGQCTTARYKINGSGDVSASSLKASIVSTGIAGSGEVSCHATDTLKVRVTGSGEVSYKGNPYIEYAPKKGLRKIN